MTLTSKPQPKTLAQALISAWSSLYPDPESGRRGNAGARASLRRAPTPDAILLEPAFHELLARIRVAGFDLARFGGDASLRHDQYLRLALCVGALVERRSTRSGKRSFMEVAGGPPDERTLSALRFRRLMVALDSSPGEASLTALRRSFKMVGDETFNLFRFVDDLMQWSETSRIRWTFDYFGRSYRQTPTDFSPSHSEEIFE